MARVRGRRPRYTEFPFQALVDSKDKPPDVPVIYEFRNSRKFVERRPYDA